MTFIPPARVGGRVGHYNYALVRLARLNVGSGRLGVGSARLFGYQHVGISNAKSSLSGSGLKRCSGILA